MTRKLATVAVPVYKPVPTELETLSLARCVEVFGSHPLTFFGPHTLNYDAYLQAAPSASITTFDDHYFNSLVGYTELLLTPGFYESFARFEFLLIYQLDAFVFEDRLAQWCAKDYDYCGAPWLGRDGQWFGVGNGGFSLRRVSAHLEVLQENRRLRPAELWDHVRRTTPKSWLRALKYPRKLLAYVGLFNDLQSYLRNWVRRGEPEDMFWGLHAVRFCPSFRVAPVEEAMLFSIEGGLEKAWSALAGRLPFGCHRNWFLEIFQRYLHSGDEPKTDRERQLWNLAAAAQLIRPNGGQRTVQTSGAG